MTDDVPSNAETEPPLPELAVLARLYTTGVERRYRRASTLPGPGEPLVLASAALAAIKDRDAMWKVKLGSNPTVSVYPPRDLSKRAEEQGMFEKFHVTRTDRSDEPGGKHHACRHFVLDLDHDEHAPAALQFYATRCRATHPLLADDIERQFGALDGAPVARVVVTTCDRPADAAEREVVDVEILDESRCYDGMPLFAGPDSRLHLAGVDAADLSRRLFDAQPSSCVCGTQSALAQDHNADCLYRILIEARQFVDVARST